MNNADYVIDSVYKLPILFLNKPRLNHITLIIIIEFICSLYINRRDTTVFVLIGSRLVMNESALKPHELKEKI